MTPATPSSSAERDETSRAAQPCLDRQRLQKLNQLLAHYDLSSDSTTDNSDLRCKLCALVSTDFQNV